MNNYDDIINLEHYEPKYHKRMSNLDRAAQFAPFAALTGYDDEIRETARLTNRKKELSEEDFNRINKYLNMLNDNKDLEVNITYFIHDKYKSGGRYSNYIGKVKRIDNVYQIIYLTNNKKILFKDIIDIEIIV